MYLHAWFANCSGSCQSDFASINLFRWGYHFNTAQKIFARRKSGVWSGEVSKTGMATAAALGVFVGKDTQKSFLQIAHNQEQMNHICELQKDVMKLKFKLGLFEKGQVETAEIVGRMGQDLRMETSRVKYFQMTAE